MLNPSYITDYNIKFSFPTLSSGLINENFYFGVWSSSVHLDVSINNCPRFIDIDVATGDNWLLASSKYDGRSLVHTLPINRCAFAFRGYLSSPPLHSYSTTNEFSSYWKKGLDRQHNGVFSSVIISENGKGLTFITDAFGMSPLYYRKHSSLILFSSNPNFLKIQGDQPDYYAWRSRIQSSSIVGDRSLRVGVSRVSPGSFIEFSSSGSSEKKWFSYNDLPKGEKMVNAACIDAAEAVFQKSMDRCLAVASEKIVLPLSSGFDSRRILSAMHSKKVDFEALTVKVYQRENRELDAHFAKELSAYFGFQHKVFGEKIDINSVDSNDSYASDDLVRQLLTGSETPLHTWAVSMLRSLNGKQGFLFDGIAGDVLGNSGYALPGLYESFNQDMDIISSESVTDDFNGILNSSLWPTAEDVRNEYRSIYETFPDNLNAPELAFLIFRTRGAIAPWAQQMLPAGNVVLCPYLDLDHIYELFSYVPSEKYKILLQKACLKKFWPEFYQFSGNRSVPSNIPPGPDNLLFKREIYKFRFLLRILRENGLESKLKNLLTIKARLKFEMSRFSDIFAFNNLWAFNALIELVINHELSVSNWKIEANIKP